ncbi:hypothetical protein [Halomicronema sp. CCY15110]|uniref:hypothetical protein n=1 Tax=Halomicronema sp. CCY15110 TaxID=2767773 RepID=UPI00194EAC51|nr:hypothetical protein [Halomicronema sp. CCY15110]
MIPLVLGAIALGSAAYGAAAGVDGVSKMKKAEGKAKRAKKRHEAAVRALEQRWDDVNLRAKDYGEFQLSILQDTVGRFVNFIESTGRQAAMSDKEFLEGLEVSARQLKQYKSAAIKAEQYFKGGVSAIAASAAGYGGAMTLATTVGVASTGTAISSLSGAAATNAILAWFGGGSLAVSGGGMALGSMVLGGITIGPAIAIGGFVLGNEGEKALTKARKYKAKVKAAIAQMEAAQAFANQVERRITELWEILDTLNGHAIEGLQTLESQPFDRKRDAQLFQRVALLVKAIADITQTPILDAEGQLNPGSIDIQAQYRSWSGKADHNDTTSEDKE